MRPAAGIASDEDYCKVDWLAKHYAFSVLPSVSSNQAFRQFAKAGGSQDPFAGFGDPLIGGKGSTIGGQRGQRVKMADHASYIDSWLKVLKNDKKAIFTAAIQASKAHGFLMERAGVDELRVA